MLDNTMVIIGGKTFREYVWQVVVEHLNRLHVRQQLLSLPLFIENFVVPNAARFLTVNSPQQVHGHALFGSTKIARSLHQLL